MVSGSGPTNACRFGWTVVSSLLTRLGRVFGTASDKKAYMNKY